MPNHSATQLVVLGSGPGGYSAAFRAADLGMEVTLVEQYPTLGGVCLNVGCIPSKALLHLAGVIEENEAVSSQGIQFGSPTLDLPGIRAFKNGAVDKLTQSVKGMAEGRKVRVVQGYGTFADDHTLTIQQADGIETRLEFEQAIIAAGSRTVQLPFLPEQDARIWDSTRAQDIQDIPSRLLIIGGGIIGLEMATVYRAFGSRVTIAETADQLIPAADKDLVTLYKRHNQNRFDIRLSTRVEAVSSREDALYVRMTDSRGDSVVEPYDAVLVAVGRRPNGDQIQAEQAGIAVDERGFISVNERQQTNKPHIFAIGDIVGQPMLAHKASHQGHVAAEVAAGHPGVFAPKVIPSIAYTHPEIAWTGLTEREARAQGLQVATAAFPWSASGRALSSGQTVGRTKLVYDPDTDTLLGAGIVGANAGELIGELSLALEFGASVEDIALTIHAHPTLHETIGLAAELAGGTITDLPNPKARKGQRAPVAS